MKITFGLIQYPESVFLHTNEVIVYLTGVLAILHSISGLGLLIIRKIRNATIGIILESITVSLIGVALITFLTILAFL